MSRITSEIGATLKGKNLLLEEAFFLLLRALSISIEAQYFILK